MRRETRDQLEEALHDVNPIPRSSDLVESDEAAAVALLVRRQIEMDAPSDRPTPDITSRRVWLKPAIAFVAACLFALATIGIVRLMRPEVPGFTDVPVPITPTTIDAPSADLTPSVWIDYSVRDTAVASDGSLWGATEVGIIRWDTTTGESTLFTTEDGLPSTNIQRLMAGPDGAIWIGSSGWMARYDGTWTTISAPSAAEGPLAVGPDGTVWTAFGESDLARFDGSEWTTVQAPLRLDQGVASPWTASLDVAPDGTLWAGTHENRGVFSFDGAQWTHYTTASGLPGRIGTTVVAAPDGSVWVGSWDIGSISGGGVARFDGTQWTHFTADDGLLDSSAEVAIGADGTIWAIHDNGVSRYEGLGWTTFPDVVGNGRGASVDDKGTLWMPAAEAGMISVIGFDGAQITRLELPIEETQPTPTPPTTALPVGSWDPILSTKEAKTAPPVATCPPGTNPDNPGLVDQARPEPGWVGNAAAAFDQSAGRIIYVDRLGDTWAFDVCTNSWTSLRPTGARLGDGAGGLVYDVDSDRIIAFGEQISIYDPGDNAWIQGSSAGESMFDFWPVGGAVYDPVSGLVIVQHEGTVKAYDVDTDRWTELGTMAEDPGYLLAHIPTLDRIFYGNGLLDPRTGEVTEVSAEPISIAGGFGSLATATGGDTAFVATDDRRICRFDPTSLDWACFARGVGTPYHVFAAMVFDSINNRLVLINSFYGDWWVDATDDVWAVDLDTGQWVSLLEAR